MAAVAPGVWATVSDLWSTGGGIIAGEGRCALVDPGVFPREIAAIERWCARHGLEVVAGLSTHAHWDHVLWPARLADVPRWATSDTATLVTSERDRLVTAELDRYADQWYTRWDVAAAGRLRPIPAAGELPWEGPRTVLVPVPGHMRGHAGVWVAEPGVLFCGDMLSDIEVPLLDEDASGPPALADYARGLRVLEALDGVRVLVPGHGSPTDAAGMRARLDADWKYLEELSAASAAAQIPDSRLRSPTVAGLHLANLRVLTR